MHTPNLVRVPDDDVQTQHGTLKIGDLPERRDLVPLHFEKLGRKVLRDSSGGIALLQQRVEAYRAHQCLDDTLPTIQLNSSLEI